jgi:hypothetical protein
MSLSGLASEIRSLLESLSSTDQLEVLLCMLRSPSRVYEATALAEELGLHPTAVEQALSELVHRRLATVMTLDAERRAYQYAPATVELHAAVEGLAIASGTHSVAIITALQSKANPTLRNFADAFRIRRGSHS